MRAFADSSTLVKIYADEEGAVEARSLDLVIVSAVSRVEVPSALWRKCSDGTLSELSADLLTREFLADLSGTPGGNFQLMVAVPVTAEILDSAGKLVRTHRLRSLDAIQLASALRAREGDARCQTFSTYDRQLGRAALLEGFTPFPSS